MNGPSQSSSHNVRLSQSQAAIIGDHGRIEGDVHFNIYTTSSGIPLQRPPRAEHFTDRQPELAQLLSDLQPGRVVTLCGPGGIGKTALAAQALWTLAPDSTDSGEGTGCPQ